MWCQYDTDVATKGFADILQCYFVTIRKTVQFFSPKKKFTMHLITLHCNLFESCTKPQEALVFEKYNNFKGKTIFSSLSPQDTGITESLFPCIKSKNKIIFLNV